MIRTGFKTPFGCDRLRNLWIFVFSKKGSRRASARLRALFTAGLDHEFLARSRINCESNPLGLLVMNNEDVAENYFSSAQNTLERMIQKRPEAASLHRSLGIAYAGLGRKEDAILSGKQAAELIPVTKNPWRGTYPLDDSARINVMVGEYDAAIDHIEFLLSVHGRLSVPLLRIDPTWAPLRDRVRFKKLVEVIE